MDEFRDGRLMRIFVDENDRRGAQPLYTAIVELLRRSGIAGATVFRGIEGFGGHKEIHVAKVFAAFPNLPVVIEAVDDAEKLEAVVPQLRELVGEGLITLEAARYLRLSRSGSSR